MEYNEKNRGNGPDSPHDGFTIMINGAKFISKIFRRIAAGIAALVPLGCLVTYAVVLTFRWLKNKIKEKMRQKNVSKVACADLEQLIEECDNTVSLDMFEDYVDKGYTHIIASVDNSGHISDVDIVKDLSDPADTEVKRFLGPDGMVVVTE